MGRRKLDSQKQNKSVSCVYLSQEQGAFLDGITHVGEITIPYSHIVRQAVNALPEDPAQVQPPAMAKEYPYRLGTSLLTAGLMDRLEHYEQMTERSRSQCIRDAIQSLMVAERAAFQL